VDLIVLAGFMRILSKQFIDEFHSRVINVHPSLLPAFKGVKSQWQAVEHGVRVSGCSTHFVTDDMDAGPIIMQKRFFLEIQVSYWQIGFFLRNMNYS